jgi:formiminotetrahydrofolate cyclodeaminase
VTDEPLVGRPLGAFLDAVASSEPAPGGGSVAALTGAASAGLLLMVCQVLRARPRALGDHGQVVALLDRAERLQEQLRSLIDADADAYRALLAARGLPRRDAFEQASRRVAVQRALARATETPVQIAAGCAEVVRLGDAVASLATGPVASDAHVARRLAGAALLAALDTADQNVGLIEDPARRADLERELASLKAAEPLTRL